jgi:hypothetical protein
MDAAAVTASSNIDVEYEPRLVSRNSDAVFRQYCSSRRTISSPYRAVDRQCTRCRLSPVR